MTESHGSRPAQEPSVPTVQAEGAGVGVEVLALRKALRNLTDACRKADAMEELSEWVDGSALDDAEAALDLEYPVIWTPEQVAMLEARQAASMSHPYTCGGNRSDALHKAQAEEDGDHDAGILIPTVRGWVCPACDYRQFWAHEISPPSAPNATSTAGEVGEDLKRLPRWRSMDTAPRDQVIIAMARYRQATAGAPAFVAYINGEWRELGRTIMEPMVCWAWMPRDVLGDWPSETASQQAAVSADTQPGISAPAEMDPNPDPKALRQMAEENARMAKALTKIVTERCDPVTVALAALPRNEGEG